MASIRRKATSKFWWACFDLPNGKRKQRSTHAFRAERGAIAPQERGNLSITVAGHGDDKNSIRIANQDAVLNFRRQGFALQ
jgi:hypothetical protein